MRIAALLLIIPGFACANEAHFAALNGALGPAYQALGQSSLALARKNVSQLGLLLNLAKSPEIAEKLRTLKKAPLGVKPWVELGAKKVAERRRRDTTSLNSRLFGLYPNLAPIFDRLAAEAVLSMMSHRQDQLGGPEHCYLADAYRHTYWAALSSKYLGPEAALLILMGHETRKHAKDGWKIPSKDQSSLMDVHNDLVGIELGQRFKNKPDALIRNKIFEMIRESQLIMLNPYDIRSSFRDRSLAVTSSVQEFSRTPAFSRECEDTDF